MIPVVVAWVPTGEPPAPAPPGPPGRWEVWLGEADGRYRPAGVFEGTEAEALAEALAAAVDGTSPAAVLVLPAGPQP